jgi:hypothetical protein
MGVSFAIIFTAANVVQSLLTTLYQDGSGFIAIAGLQWSFAIGSLFAPGSASCKSFVSKSHVLNT